MKRDNKHIHETTVSKIFMGFFYRRMENKYFMCFLSVLVQFSPLFNGYGHGAHIQTVENSV